MSGTDDSFQIERHAGGVLVISPPQDVESLQWDLVESAADLVIEPIQQQSIPMVLFDLSNVEFFGSVFLSLMLRCWKVVATRNGTMVLCGASDAARELLRLTALDTLWPIYDTADEAIEMLNSD